MHRWHEIKPKININEEKIQKISLFSTEHYVISSRCLQLQCEVGVSYFIN